MNKKEKPSKRTAKKKLIVIAAVVLLAIVLLLICSAVIDKIEEKENTSNEEIEYSFYPADYGENIFEDEEYLSVIDGEFMRYCDLRTNVTSGIDKSSAAEQGGAVEFIVNMLYDAINGDADAYNANFSDTYYEDNSPKSDFTMQKIYDVTITYVSEEKIDNYTRYFYYVEYKIYHNNGTFRRDIGDGAKKQLFTITDRTGVLLVDSVSTVKLHG